MDLEQYSSIASRIGFYGAAALLVMAVVEKLANTIGYTTFLGSVAFPARMLEYAVVLLIFVIALLLRQIREQLNTEDAA